MELNAVKLVRRYCYLNSFQSVYKHTLKPELTLQYMAALPWTRLLAALKEIDDVTLIPILQQALHDSRLRHREGPLIVLAIYLSEAELDIKWKTEVRKAFPLLIRTDSDLFLFCKFASAQQQKIKRHGGFNRTTRRAIKSWYEMQPENALREMWLTHRGANGFTHKLLMKLCYVSDDILGATDVANAFNKNCSKLIKEFEDAEKETQTTIAEKETETTVSNTKAEADDAEKQTQTEKSNTKTENDAETPEEPEDDNLVLPQQADDNKQLTPATAYLLMSKLRATKLNTKKALAIINKLKLRYHQVPHNLLRNASIVRVLIPTMSYIQLLQFWRRLIRYEHYKAPAVLKACRRVLHNERLMRQANLHPFEFLLQMSEVEQYCSKEQEQREDKIKLIDQLKLRELYLNSFGQNSGIATRMHITINLQSSYLKKKLKNCKKLQYATAALSLAFGYFKSESWVEVFYWAEERAKLQRIPWKKTMSLLEANEVCSKIENKKNEQRLITPLMQAMRSTNVYDVFLLIVPTSGRGNPSNSSELLCKFLDKYREQKNPNAKFIILNLLKFKPSLQYSQTRSENIFEICGLDEHTTDLIHNFVTERFV